MYTFSIVLLVANSMFLTENTHAFDTIVSISERVGTQIQESISFINQTSQKSEERAKESQQLEKMLENTEHSINNVKKHAEENLSNEVSKKMTNLKEKITAV